MAEQAQKNSARANWIRTAIAVIAIAAIAGGLIYWQVLSKRVYVDSSTIQAPQIELAPSQAGTLQSISVQVGDAVPAYATVAQVGNQLVQTKVAGTVISINQKIGAEITPGESVVTMIDPAQLRVVGEVDEDKGLSKIQVGDPVTFTVDAFGGKSFSGIVDEVSPTSNESGIVFNISDQREVQQFDVKARFDQSAYTQLKNGMSARMWIYQQ